MKTWHNGKIIEGKPPITSFNWTMHYSSSVWEGIRSYVQDSDSYFKKTKFNLFKVEDHIKRLFNSARMLRMNIPYTKEELISACWEVAKVNNATEQDLYIRPIVYYGQDAEGIRSQTREINVDIFAIPIKHTYKKEGIKVKTYPKPRGYPIYEMQCKGSNNYGEATLWDKEAKQSGVDDVLMTDNEGYYSEASVANLFIIKDNIVYTPPDDGNILPGITRLTVMDMIIPFLNLDPSVSVQIKKITRPDIIAADEVFITGTYAEVVPVIEFDGYIIGDGKPGLITKGIRKTYQNLVKTGRMYSPDDHK